MEIYPDNLGPELEAEVYHNREAPLSYLAVRPASLVIGAALLCDVFLTLGLWLMSSPPLTEWLGICSVVFLLGGYIKQRSASAHLARLREQARLPAPVTDTEVHYRYFSYSAKSLVRNYLSLAASVIRADVSDPDAQKEVRAALQALGSTAVTLPDESPNTVIDDPAALHSEAARLSAEADAEPDAVIGASLRRRAESLTRRADTAGKTLLLLRRNQALRQETAEQMEALQTSLTAFRVGGQPSVPELADLAASIQRVAREASAITDARAEVGTLLAAPGRLQEDTTESLRQSVGG